MSNRPWYVIVGLALGALALLSVVCFFLYRVRAILPPFIIAFGIAFLLDPLIERLQCHNCPRVFAVTAVFAIFLAVFVLSIVFLVPEIIQQAGQLGHDYPKYAEGFRSVVSDVLDKHHVLLAKFELPTSLQEIAAKYGNQTNEFLKKEVPQVGTWLIRSLSMLPWIVLIPLIAFYFLNDFSRIRHKTLLFIPEKYRQETANVLLRMGAVFSTYVRGLTILCLMYAVVVTILLSILKLRYGIIIGLAAGILYAVPYLGAITTAILVFFVGVATYPAPATNHALITLVCVLVTNQIFDLVITPRILGKSVGLHPILSLFAMLSGGTLFGPAGMILAVPIAASIQEIVFEFYPELRKDPLSEARAESPTPFLQRLLKRKRKSAST